MSINTESKGSLLILKTPFLFVIPPEIKVFVLFLQIIFTRSKGNFDLESIILPKINPVFFFYFLFVILSKMKKILSLVERTFSCFYNLGNKNFSN